MTWCSRDSLRFLQICRCFRKLLSQQNTSEWYRSPSFKTQPVHNPTTPKRSRGQVEICTVTTLNIMRHSFSRNYIPDISAGQNDFKSTCIVQLLIKHPPTSAIPPFLIKGNVPTCMRNMKIAKLWTIPLRRTVWWSPLWLHLQGTSKLVQAIHHFIRPSYGSRNASIIALSSKGPFIGVMNGARRLSAQSLCHLSQWMCLIREVPVQFQDILCTGHPFCALL